MFAINHTHQDGSVDAEGTDLLTGQVHPAPPSSPPAASWCSAADSEG